MQKKDDFSEAVFQSTEYLKNVLHYKPVTIRHYRARWRLIKDYMDLHDIDSLSISVFESYLKHIYSGRSRENLTENEKLNEKAASVLLEFIETGSIQPKKKIRHLTGSIGVLIKEYLDFKQSFRLSHLTIEKIEGHLSNFNFWLFKNEIYKIDTLGPSHVIGFVRSLNSEKKAMIHDTLNNLRGFFHYLNEKRIIASNLAALVPKDNYKTQAKLPSYYSKEEIQQLLDSVDRGNSIGKRDYAILILATRLGLRASDIARLKFENLHWNENTLSIKQFKTGKNITLPLLPEVGNAIIDYIQYGRPQSDKPFLFLLAYSPYQPIKSGTIANMTGRRFHSSGLKTKERKHGAHALRHSLVGELLCGNQPLPIIAEVLGHQNVASSKHYIRIDVESLRKCALDVPPVDIVFYNQEGRNYFF